MSIGPRPDVSELSPPLPGTLSGLVRHWAERTPQAAALCAPDRTPLSYRDLWELIRRTARQLNGFGIGRNDRVALVLPNGPEMAAGFLSVSAVAGCGPLNPTYRSSEFLFFLRDMQSKALIVLKGDPQPAARRAAGELGLDVIELEPRPGERAGLFSLAPQGPRSHADTAWSGQDDAALLLHTSGTTSRPKLVPLTQANLAASASHVAETLQLTARDRCLNVMPLFHIHGLVACLLASLRAGASVGCTAGFYAPSFFSWLDDLAPTWYSAVPTMHQAILARAGANRAFLDQARLRFVRSSSAPLPPRVFQELERAFRCPVIESYGMTEASHQVTSNPLPPMKRKPGSVGLPAGPQVSILDRDSAPVEPGKVGEVAIRGPNVTRGYENNPQADSASFVRGWFRTGDEGYLDRDGYLVLTGRIKEIINKGGEKISPREIDEVMLEHPVVAQAVAFSMPDERLGEEVGLAVVLKEGGEVSPQELRRFAARRLADFKVPATVLVLDEIPKGPTGKVQRIGLAERLGLPSGESRSPKAPAAFVPPRTPTERALADLWCKILGLEEVGVDDRFLDLGGDSMLAMVLLSRIRSQMQMEVDMVDFFAAPTIARQADLIDGILFSEIEAESGGVA